MKHFFMEIEREVLQKLTVAIEAESEEEALEKAKIGDFAETDIHFEETTKLLHAKVRE